MTGTGEASSQHASNLIPELCRQFYTLGWVSGTGGGMSIRDPVDSYIYIAPSGVQKERIASDDLFILNSSGSVIKEPDASKGLKMSECTPLFMAAYSKRNAGAVIHSHAKYAVLATLLSENSLNDKNEFKITHQEMIKGIKKGSTRESFKYDDELIVPIIENTRYEKDLTDRLSKAIDDYPDTNAVLVRRHGVYIWGQTWQQAKAMAEVYHYLFEMAVEMERLDLVASRSPTLE